MSNPAPTPAPARQDAFDALRLVAILGVICLHHRFQDTDALTAGVAVRLFMRWSVPFFFLLTGFFLKPVGAFADAGGARLLRIVVIMLVANLLYLPLALATQGIGALSIDVLALGTWFHLWFLNAMVTGFLLLQALPWLLRKPGAMTAFCLVLLAALVVLDALAPLDPERLTRPVELLRQLQALPFMWLGFVLSQRREALPGAATGLALAALGLALTLAEGWLWTARGIGQMERIMPPGAILVALGLLVWCARAPASTLLARMARLGREHALTIYVIHPPILKVGGFLVSRTIPGLSLDAVAFGGIAFTMVAAPIAALVLARVWPAFARLLQGRIEPPPALSSRR